MRKHRDDGAVVEKKKNLRKEIIDLMLREDPRREFLSPLLEVGVRMWDDHGEKTSCVSSNLASKVAVGLLGVSDALVTLEENRGKLKHFIDQTKGSESGDTVSVGIQFSLPGCLYTRAEVREMLVAEADSQMNSGVLKMGFDEYPKDHMFDQWADQLIAEKFTIGNGVQYERVDIVVSKRAARQIVSIMLEDSIKAHREMRAKIRKQAQELPE